MTLGLGAGQLDLISETIAKFPKVTKAVVFGSRAKGTHRRYSDIDIAVFGAIDWLDAEKLVEELEELPLIYKFDVLDYSRLSNDALKGHIDRVGVPIFDASHRDNFRQSKDVTGYSSRR
jgi:predicted nucleotidyltransferase